MNAGLNDEGVIRGLSIDTSAAVSNGYGASGIGYLSARSLFVEDTSLAGTGVGYVKAGIVAEGTTSPRRLVVRNLVERGYTVGLAVGLLCCSPRPDSVEIVVEDGQFNENALAGIHLEITGGSEAVIRGSVLSHNGSGLNGSGLRIFQGDPLGPGGKVTLDDDVFSYNTNYGVAVYGYGGQPTVALTRNVIVYNPTDVYVEECPSNGGPCGGGTLAYTMRHNTVHANDVNVSGDVTPYTGL